MTTSCTKSAWEGVPTRRPSHTRDALERERERERERASERERGVLRERERESLAHASLSEREREREREPFFVLGRRSRARDERRKRSVWGHTDVGVPV